MAKGAIADGKFAFVQALRGIAAFWVLLFHASASHHIDALKAELPNIVNLVVFDMGHYGVAIFFALSGFVIAHSVRRIDPTLSYLGRFIARRAIRLDPPYWASIAFVLGMAFLSAHVKAESFDAPSVRTLIAHLFYLQILLGEPSINSVYWTLTYEVQFYIFFVAMMILAHRPTGRIAWSIPLCWGLMALLTVPALYLPNSLLTGLFTDLWPAFFIGVLAYHAPRDRRALAGLLALALAMALATGVMERTFAQISAATALLLAISFRTDWIERGLDWRWLQFLGTISYSLYLLHNPISGAAGFLVHKYVGQGVGADLVALTVIVVGSVVGAAIFWAMIERPSQRLSRRVRLTTGRS